MGIQVDVTNFVCGVCRRKQAEVNSVKDEIEAEIAWLNLSIAEKGILLPAKEAISDSPICASNDEPLDFGHGAELLETAKIDQ